MRPLSAEALSTVAGTVPTPTYDRRQVRTGIVHIGVGGFHRAHQAAYLDQLMNEGKALDWGITGIGLLPHDRHMHEVMTAQDCLYTMVVKHPDGSLHPRVVGSIVHYLFAPDDPEAVLELMSDPGTRIVSLTITEGGYLVHPVTGEFDSDDPATQKDLRPDSTPTTAFGFITEALSRRRERGLHPFTVMSCDNIPGNGEVAHKMIGAFARLKDPELADWLEREVSFPNSMVDRITRSPRTRTGPCSPTSSGSRTPGRSSVSRSPNGRWKTTSVPVAHLSRTSASRWSTTSSPTS